MHRLAPLALLLLPGCCYVTKAPSGTRYAVIQQPSFTSAPGVTHVERQENDGNWEYVGTFTGGTTLGEIAGAAGFAALAARDQEQNQSVSISSPPAPEGPPGPPPWSNAGGNH